MKRMLAFFCALLLILPLSACSGKGKMPPAITTPIRGEHHKPSGGVEATTPVTDSESAPSQPQSPAQTQAPAQVQHPYLEFVLSNYGETYGVRLRAGATAPAEIVIPETFDGKTVSYLLDFAFAQASGSTSIVLPKTVKAVDNTALHENIKKISCTGDTVLGMDYSERITSLVIHSGDVKIGAFSGYEMLQSLEIGTGVTELGLRAFADCYQLKTVAFREGITKIGEGAFSDCGRLERLVFPNSLKEIGQSAFSGCESLRSVHIGNNLSWIGYWAFFDCQSLKGHFTVSSQNLTYMLVNGELCKKNGGENLTEWLFGI